MTSTNSISIYYFKISVSSDGKESIYDYGNTDGSRIPESINRAIYQKFFAATGGTETEPVVMGRTIREGIKVYSIISTVVREQGKDLYLYLYLVGFITKNQEYKYEDFSKLAFWLDQQNSVPTHRHYPSQGQYGVQELSKSDFPRQIESIRDFPEVDLAVKTKDKYSFQEIDSHVSIPQSSDQNTNSIGWAFNVTSLEKAKEFQYIIAANAQVYSSISNQLMSHSTRTANSALAITTPAILTPLIIPAKRYELEIHEFSTGILTEGDRSNWVSKRFTVGYMNATIDPIPNIVEVAISNNLFQTVGGHPNQPAIVGRVLEGKTDRWSVVAVVTTGEDFEGRTLSAFRYFLAEGTENIHAIVGWLEERRRENKLPIFNPFDSKRLGQSHKVTIETPESIIPDINWLNEPTASVTEANYQISLQDINDLAYAKSHQNRKPISWAYNVYSLKSPDRFQIIHPVNDASRNAIHLALSGSRQQPKALQASDVRLDPKILLKNLIGQLIPSDDLVIDLLEQMRERSTFNNGLSQDIAANKRYWEEVFESFDAAKGLSERLYTPQMVRLLTWKAIIFPETLPEFVNWLHDGDSNQINKNQGTTLELEEGLSRHIDTIEDNLILGIVELTINLFSQEENSSLSVSNIAWILENSSTRLWASLKDEVITRFIERVLPITINKTNSSKAWQGFIQLTLEQPTGWHDFYAGIRDYENNKQSNKKYIYVAEFFEQLGSGQPKNLWIRLKDFILGVSQLLIFMIAIILVTIFDVSSAANIAKETSFLVSMFAPLAGLASVSLVTRSFISAFLVGIPHIIFIGWRLCLDVISHGVATAALWTISLAAIWLIYEAVKRLQKSKAVNTDAYALAAVFYTISQGSVSQSVFDNATKSNYVNNGNVQGFGIARSKTIDGSLIRIVKSIVKSMQLKAVIIFLAICALFLGVTYGLKDQLSQNPLVARIFSNPNCPIPKPNWESTRAGIKKIVDDTTLELPNSESDPQNLKSQVIYTLFTDTLDISNESQYDYNTAIDEGQKSDVLVSRWRESIKAFQDRNQRDLEWATPTGYFREGDLTSRLIRHDLRTRLAPIIPPTPVPSPTPPPSPAPVPTPSPRPTAPSMTIDQRAIDTMFREVQQAVDPREGDQTKTQQAILQAFKEVLVSPSELQYPIRDNIDLKNWRYGISLYLTNDKNKAPTSQQWKKLKDLKMQVIQRAKLIK